MFFPTRKINVFVHYDVVQKHVFNQIHLIHSNAYASRNPYIRKLQSTYIYKNQSIISYPVNTLVMPFFLQDCYKNRVSFWCSQHFYPTSVISPIFTAPRVLYLKWWEEIKRIIQNVKNGDVTVVEWIIKHNFATQQQQQKHLLLVSIKFFSIQNFFFCTNGLLRSLIIFILKHTHFNHKTYFRHKFTTNFFDESE